MAAQFLPNQHSDPLTEFHRDVDVDAIHWIDADEPKAGTTSSAAAREISSTENEVI